MGPDRRPHTTRPPSCPSVRRPRRVGPRQERAASEERRDPAGEETKIHSRGRRQRSRSGSQRRRRSRTGGRRKVSHLALRRRTLPSTSKITDYLCGSLAAAEPIDLDRRCGVINDKNTPCLRSLTCKSHGMGPKRDVQGRSKPFDVLLLEWNRTNNPRWVEPKTRRKNQHDFGDDGGKRNGSGAGGSSGGGKKSSGKRDHHGGGSSSRRRGGRNGDDDSLDGGARSSPESELASLIAAAQASRSRLSAPTRGSSSSSSGSGLALSIGTSTYRAVGSAGGGVALAFGAGGGVPREGWKGSLFGRRRETLRALDRSFRDALGVK